MNITLGFSTLHGNYSRLLAYLDTLKLSQGFDILVVVQGYSQFSKELIEIGSATITVVRADSVGLSLSRNLVIQHAKGDFIWFLDDDVILDALHLAQLQKAVSRNDADVFLGQIECSDCEGMYKRYSRPFLRILMPLRASSIEVIVKRKFLQTSAVLFDPMLGLGGEFPAGEENAFLADLLMAGATFRPLGFPIVLHPCLMESRSPSVRWRNPKILVARGMVAKHFGGWSPFVLMYFIFQTAIVTRSIGGVKSILAGYLK